MSAAQLATRAARGLLAFALLSLAIVTVPLANDAPAYHSAAGMPVVLVVLALPACLLLLAAREAHAAIVGDSEVDR